MNRVFLAAGIAGCVLGSAAASAQGLRIHRSCLHRICTTTFLPTDAPGLGKTIDVPMDPEDVGRDQRIEKWHNYCLPKIIVDSLGVSRYAYAHKDCDIGRSE